MSGGEESSIKDNKPSTSNTPRKKTLKQIVVKLENNISNIKPIIKRERKTRLRQV